MFSLNEKIVYAGHGVAEITRIVEKQVAGSVMHLFELRFINKDMTILVPMSKLNAVGVRRLSSDAHIQAAFKILSQPVKENFNVTINNWNKRNKEYQCKLRTGDINEICKIYRDLKHISIQKELSFGEKSLLDKTESLLVEEISLAQSVEEDKAIQQLRAFFSTARKPHAPQAQMM